MTDSEILAGIRRAWKKMGSSEERQRQEEIAENGRKRVEMIYAEHRST